MSITNFCCFLYFSDECCICVEHSGRGFANLLSNQQEASILIPSKCLQIVSTIQTDVLFREVNQNFIEIQVFGV